MSEPQFLSRTRDAYNTVAAAYAKRFEDELASKPFDVAILAAFAQLVQSADAGPVVDVGCGPGLVTAHLHSLGLSVSGVDLSSEMIAQARRAHPELRFELGSMTALDLADSGLGGLVAWYSTMHFPTGILPEVFSEFRRVLAPGGYALVAFQVGDEERRLTEWFGHEIELDFHLRTPDLVGALLNSGGFAPVAELRRVADELETLPRAYLLVRKPIDPAA